MRWFILLFLLLSLSQAQELFKLKWKEYVGRYNWASTNHPLIFGKYVLHATSGDKNNKKDSYDKLYVFDKDGNLLWSFEGKDDMNGVVASNRLIMVTDDAGWVYALSWEGSLLWKFKAGDGVSSPALGDLNGDGVLDVVVGSWDDHIYALSSEDGRLLWKFGTGSVRSSPALGDLNRDGVLDVVVGSLFGHIYALSGEDGRLLWKFRTGGSVYSSPVLGDLDGDGVLDVVVGSGDDHIYALSGKDGRLMWKFKTGNWVYSSPALGDLNGDGVPDVVVGSSDKHIYALSGEDGRLLWKFRTGSVRSSPALGDLNRDGVLDVVVGSGDDHIYALSGKDGRLMWKFKTGAGVNSSPALGDLDGDGYIDMAVASLDGYLYVFEATRKGGEVVWSRWHGDAAGTGLYENAVSFAQFNMSGKAFAWKPREMEFVSPKLILRLAKKLKLYSLQKATYRPASHPKINAVKRKKALEMAVRMARADLKRKLAKEVKRVVERLVREAELSDTETAKAVYNNVLAKVFEEVDKLEPLKAIKGNEIYVLLNGDGIIRKANVEDYAADMIAKVLEGQRIRVVTKVEVPELKLKPSRSSEIKVTSMSVKTAPEKKERLRECVRPNPSYYLFGVVVYDYDEIGSLDYVRNDKELIKTLATCYMGVPEENMKILENPAYAKLKRELRKFARGIRRRDATLYFYYSGHGILDSKGRFYILPSDASIEDELSLRESGIDIVSLKKLLSRAKGKKVALIDACRVKPRWKPAVVVYKPRLRNIAMIFSTKEGQLSNVDRERRYSAFTRALYEMARSGLTNLDFDDDGYVEIKELIKPLTKWVRRVSADGRQTPDVWGPKEFEIFPVE